MHGSMVCSYYELNNIMHGSMGYRFYQNSLLAGINFRQIWGFTKIVDIGIYESSGCLQKHSGHQNNIVIILLI